MKLRKMWLNINGANRMFAFNPEKDSLADVLRRLGLTGTKIGCGTGVCGACSVILNGKVIRSCTKKMKRVSEHSEITTIEGIGLMGIAEETARRHRDAFGTSPVLATSLDVGGAIGRVVRLFHASCVRRMIWIASLHTMQAAVSSENCSLKEKPSAPKKRRVAGRSLTGRLTKIMRMEVLQFC